MTADKHVATASTNHPLTVLRRFPTGVMVFLALLVGLGVAVAVRYFGKEPVAKCGNDPMEPGDGCTIRRRRSGTSEWTYEERLEWSGYENLSWVAAGLTFAAIALIVIILVVFRWTRDRAVAGELADSGVPETAYARATGMATALATPVVGVVAGFSAWMAVRAFGGKGGPALGLLIAAVAAAVAVSLLWKARPKGATLVWSDQDTARIVTESTARAVPWTDVQYTSTFTADPTKHLTWVGHRGSVEIPETDFFDEVRGRVNAALREGLPARLESGAELDFRAVKVAGPTVTIGKKAVPGAELGQVAMVQDKNHGVVFDFQDQRGQSVQSVPAQQVGNADVLFDVLSRQFGVSLKR